MAGSKQGRDSYASTAALGGSAACATTSGETEAGTIASRNTAASVTTSGGSAALATTSSDIMVDVGNSVVVCAAQTHQKAIPIMGSTLDRGISSGTGGLE